MQGDKFQDSSKKINKLVHKLHWTLIQLVMHNIHSQNRSHQPSIYPVQVRIRNQEEGSGHIILVPRQGEDKKKFTRSLVMHK